MRPTRKQKSEIQKEKADANVETHILHERPIVAQVYYRTDGVPYFFVSYDVRQFFDRSKVRNSVAHGSQRLFVRCRKRFSFPKKISLTEHSSVAFSPFLPSYPEDSLSTAVR